MQSSDIINQDLHKNRNLNLHVKTYEFDQNTTGKKDLISLNKKLFEQLKEEQSIPDVLENDMLYNMTSNHIVPL